MANAVQKVTGPRLMLQHKYLAASQGAQKSLEPPEAPVIGCRRRLVVPRMRRGWGELYPTLVLKHWLLWPAQLWEKTSPLPTHHPGPTDMHTAGPVAYACPAALWFISLDRHQEVCLKVSVCVSRHSALWVLLFITGNIMKYHSKRYNYCLTPHGTALWR